VVVASAGQYASLHLAPDSTSPLSFFTGRMRFLPPNQQRQKKLKVGYYITDV